ncbi:MAG: hypothetical protein IJS32_08220 [Kiritimatiellae bacterium]|nr:hypothetical protein [Kiritimatiellia bacterium]
MKSALRTAAALVLAAATALPAFAQGDASVPQGTKKMMLKIATVETAGTRHQKTWDPPAKPLQLQEKPYSEAQIMQAKPEEADRMRAKNEIVGDAQRLANAKIAIQNWAAADKHMKGIQAQLEGNAYGRQIILALDKFAGEAGQHFDPDCIEFFHRADMDEGQKEQFMQDMTDPGVLAAPYFIKLVFDDPREETGIVQMNGQQIKMAKYMQTVTYEVQDLQGKIAAAGNVRQEKQVRTSNAIERGGTSGNEQVAVLEEALAEVAKRINDRFVAKVSFTLVGPRNDDAFDEYAGTILVDGEGRTSGDEFSLLKGPHVVEVEMQGYKRTGSPRLTVSASQNYKIPMVSSMCEVTVQVKGPAGDAEFDPDYATISLSGDEGEYPLSNGYPMEVPQGRYTLTVEADGCQPVTKPVVLAAPKMNLPPVVLKKAAGF